MSTLRRNLSLAVEIGLVLVVGALVLGAVLGQPILFSYVTTGSMEPTLDPGDGFVALPPVVAGDVSEGDVVTFQAEALHGGGLTTHRIVERTEHGYVTQGDANAFTDQQGPEPPVKEREILAVALQINGNVVTIPNLGDGILAIQGVMEYAKRSLGGLFGTRAFLGMQGTATIVFVLSVLAYLVDLALGSDRDEENRHERTRKKGLSGTVIVLSCAAIIVLAATSSMLLTAGGQVYTIDSVENTNNGGLETGTSERTNYTYINKGFVPMVVIYETDQPDISVTRDSQFVAPRSSRNATVVVTAPEEPGRYERRVSQRQYIGVLPKGVIEALYDVHPMVPILVIDAVVGGVFFLVGYWIVGTGTIKSRSRDKPGKLRAFLSRFM